MPTPAGKEPGARVARADPPPCAGSSANISAGNELPYFKHRDCQEGRRTYSFHLPGGFIVASLADGNINLNACHAPPHPSSCRPVAPDVCDA